MFPSVLVEALNDLRAGLNEMRADNNTMRAHYKAVHDRRSTLAQETFIGLFQGGAFASDADCAEPLDQLATVDEQAEGIFERVKMHTRLIETHQLFLDAIARVEASSSSAEYAAVAKGEGGPEAERSDQEQQQLDLECERRAVSSEGEIEGGALKEGERE